VPGWTRGLLSERAPDAAQELIETQATVAIVGIGILTFAAVLLMRALLVLFQYPNQILAVAHTVVKETTRSRISLVFIVLLLVILPLLPLWLDP